MEVYNVILKNTKINNVIITEKIGKAKNNKNSVLILNFDLLLR